MILPDFISPADPERGLNQFSTEELLDELATRKLDDAQTARLLLIFGSVESKSQQPAVNTESIMALVERNPVQSMALLIEVRDLFKAKINDPNKIFLKWLGRDGLLEFIVQKANQELPGGQKMITEDMVVSWIRWLEQKYPTVLRSEEIRGSVGSKIAVIDSRINTDELNAVITAKNQLPSGNLGEILRNQILAVVLSKSS